MATNFQYSGDQLPYCLIGSGSGSAGDLMFLSSGTAFTVKSQADGTGCALAFLGVLEETTPAGSYGAIACKGIFQIPNWADDVCELGLPAYIGTAGVNSIGTLDTGTSIGIFAKRAAAADDQASVLIIPFWESRAAG